jgi:gliding motility-associated-like protein
MIGLAIFITAENLCSQTFTTLAPAPFPLSSNFPGIIYRPGNSIYIPGGHNGAYTNEWRHYNLTGNIWNTIIAPSSMGSCMGFAFNLNDRLFAGGGVDGGFVWSNQVWEFFPGPDTFALMDPIPTTIYGRAYGFCFEIGGYGYVGKGFGGNGSASSMLVADDFLRFDPNAATGLQWTVMSPYPGDGTYNHSFTSLNGYGYTGLGMNDSTLTGTSGVESTDFWRYDPNNGVGGTWTQMATFPGAGRETAILLPFCYKLILMGGWNRNTNAMFDEIWEFDPSTGATGTWTLIGNNTLVTGPSGCRYGAGFVAWGDSLFFGLGGNPATGVGASDWVLMNFPPCAIIANFSANDTIICAASCVDFTDQSLNNPDTWQWSFPGAIPGSSTIQNPTNICYPSPGLYDVTLIASSGLNSDTLTLTTYMEVNSIPVVSITPNPDSICAGTSDILTASGAGSYIWAPDTGLSDTTGSSVTAGPANTITYTVTGTIAGCTGSNTITLTVIPNPVVTIAPSSALVCPGESIILTAGGAMNYSWTPATGLNQTTGATVIAAPDNTTTYTVNGISGDCSASETITVTVLPYAIAEAGNDTTIDLGDFATLHGSGGITYSWTPQDYLTCSDCPSPQASPVITTTYTLTVTDSNGCQATDFVTVFVDIKCGEVYIPTIFSPNGDGINDIFYVRGNCITKMKFRVYDRWGEKIFSSEDPAIGWDGKYRGIQMDPGTFVYFVIVTFTDGSEVKNRGNFTLVK